MERERLLEEYKVTLDCFVEKTKFVYSEAFYALDEFERQKYTKDKLATEAHLSTLCELLWGNTIKLDNGLGGLFGLTLLNSMFNSGGFGSMPPLPKFELQDTKNAKSENNAL